MVNLRAIVRHIYKQGESTGHAVQWLQFLLKCGDYQWFQSAPSIPSLTIGGSAVESTKSLGVHITEELSWTHSTASLAKNAKHASTAPANWEERGPQLPIMCSFNRGTAESILTSCLTGWFGNSFAANHRSLKRIVNTAREITGASLSSLLDLYNTHQACQAISIVCQSTHLSYNFSSPLPSGRRSWSLHDSSSRLRNSFIQQAVRILNSLSSLPAPHSQEDSHTHTHSQQPLHFT